MAFDGFYLLFLNAGFLLGITAGVSFRLTWLSLLLGVDPQKKVSVRKKTSSLKPKTVLKKKGEARNAAAILNASVDHQKIRTAEIEIPVIAAGVLTYEGGELGDAYPERTRLYYPPDALKDPEYLQTVLRSPLQVKTHEKNTNEYNRSVDGWPTSSFWDEAEQRVKLKGVVHGDENIAYVEENRNKPDFGTSAFISFLEVARESGTTPKGEAYDAVVRKAVNNHVMIGPNVRDPKNVVLAMNAVDGGAENAKKMSPQEMETAGGPAASVFRRAQSVGDMDFGQQVVRLADGSQWLPDRDFREWIMWKAPTVRNTNDEPEKKEGLKMPYDKEDFKAAMQAYQADEKAETDRIKNAVEEAEKKKKDEEAANSAEAEEKKKKEEAANAEEEKKKKEDEAANAVNAYPSEAMVKDFSEALGVTFKKTPTLKELAAVSGVTAENDAALITALNAKRKTFATGDDAAAMNDKPKSVKELLAVI